MLWRTLHCLRGISHWLLAISHWTEASSQVRLLQTTLQLGLCTASDDMEHCLSFVTFTVVKSLHCNRLCGVWVTSDVVADWIPVVGLLSHPLGKSLPPKPTSCPLSTDWWCNFSLWGHIESILQREHWPVIYGHPMEYDHNCLMALFPGPPGWADARRELVDFMVQGKINRGRHTDHPAGCHSIRTNQCLPPPSPIFFTCWMPSLLHSQQHQSTEGNWWNEIGQVIIFFCPVVSSVFYFFLA